MITKKIIFKAKIEDRLFFDLRNKKRIKLLELSDITMFWGLRGNGKSYSAKDYVVRRVMKEYLDGKTNSFKQFGYVRRTQELIKLASSTWGNRFNFKDGYKIEANKNGIFLFKEEEYTKKEEIKIKKKLIGRIGVWGQIKIPENNKSLEYDEVDTLFIDEFVNEQGMYLPYEPERLASLIESVGRNKNMTIFMCGNSVSPENPYFSYYGLGGQDIPPKNWCYVYEITNEDGTKKRIGIEHVGLSKTLEKKKREGTSGRLSSGTRYGSYSMGENFLINNAGMVLTNPKERLEFNYNVKLEGRYYEVHSYGKWGVFIREGWEPQGKIYFLTKQDAVSEGKQNGFTNPEWFYFFLSGKGQRGCLFFKDIDTKEIFQKWLTKIKSL